MLYKTGDSAECRECHAEVTLGEDGRWESEAIDLCLGDNWAFPART